MTERIRGTTVSFSDDRGFGFVRPDDGSADCFVRWTEIQGDGYRSLTVDGRVEFEPVETPEGRQALAVARLD